MLSDLDKIIEKQIATVFKLGMLDALGGRNKPDPLPAVREAGEKIKQAFADAGYVQIYQNKNVPMPVMTGQEWYDRFKAEYHMRADWISADPTMGDDAEHDVLLAARLAANLSMEDKGDE
jgi:hypothetical protein